MGAVVVHKTQTQIVSYLAVDLYDKHGKCAYLQAERHPIFVLEHKHT